MNKQFLQSVAAGILGLTLVASCSLLNKESHKCGAKNGCAAKKDEAHKCGAKKAEVKAEAPKKEKKAKKSKKAEVKAEAPKTEEKKN